MALASGERVSATPLGARSRAGLPQSRRQQANVSSVSLSPRCGCARAAPPAPGTVCAVSADGAPPAAQAVLDRYRALLHDYRQHKARLGDWFRAVSAAQRRPPQISDAQATGDEQLVAAFQRYLEVRGRLLAEIPLLREELDGALQLQQQQHAPAGGAGGRRRPHAASAAANANQASPVSRAQAVGQFYAAVDYRRRHRPERGAAGAGAAAAAAATAEGQAPPKQQEAAAAAQAAPTSSGSAWGGQQQQQQKHDQAEHLLAAASSSGSGSGGGGGGGGSGASGSRATAAALAALAYKKAKAGGSASGMAAAGSPAAAAAPAGARPLAVLQAEPPPPPPGYRPGDGAAAPVIGAVETARGGASSVYAGRRQRQLDRDVSLEATLQGVPGGLGGGCDAPMFAAAAAAPAGSGAGLQRQLAVLLAEPPPPPPGWDGGGGGAGAVVETARGDVYSGRVRRLGPEAQLDEFFAGLAGAGAAQQTELAAVAAAAAAGASEAAASPAAAAGGEPGGGVSGAPAGAQQARQPGGKAAGTGARGQPGPADSIGGGDGLGLPGILPVPT